METSWGLEIDDEVTKNCLISFRNFKIVKEWYILYVVYLNFFLGTLIFRIVSCNVGRDRDSHKAVVVIVKKKKKVVVITLRSECESKSTDRYKRRSSFVSRNPSSSKVRKPVPFEFIRILWNNNGLSFLWRFLLSLSRFYFFFRQISSSDPF